MPLHTLICHGVDTDNRHAIIGAMLTPEELKPTRFTMAGAILEQIMIVGFWKQVKGRAPQNIRGMRSIGFMANSYYRLRHDFAAVAPNPLMRAPSPKILFFLAGPSSGPCES